MTDNTDIIGSLSVDIVANTKDIDTDIDRIEKALQALAGRSFTVPFAIPQTTIDRLETAVALATSYAQKISSIPGGAAALAGMPAAAATQAAPTSAKQAPIAAAQTESAQINVDTNLQEKLDGLTLTALQNKLDKLNVTSLQTKLNELNVKVASYAHEAPPSSAAPAGPAAMPPAGRTQPLPGAYNQAIKRDAVRELTPDLYGELQASIKKANGSMLGAAQEVDEQIHQIFQRYGSPGKAIQFGPEGPGGVREITGGHPELVAMAKTNANLQSLLMEWSDVMPKVADAYQKHNIANLYAPTAPTTPPPAAPPPPSAAEPAMRRRWDTGLNAQERLDRVTRRLAERYEKRLTTEARLSERELGPSGPTYIPPAPIKIDRLLREVSATYPAKQPRGTDGPAQYQPIIGRQEVSLGGREQKMVGRLGFEGATKKQLNALWSIQQAAQAGEMRGWVERLNDKGKGTGEWLKMVEDETTGKYPLKPNAVGDINGQKYRALTDVDAAKVMMLGAGIPEDIVTRSMQKAPANSGEDEGRMLQVLERARKLPLGMSANLNFIPMASGGGSVFKNLTADEEGLLPWTARQMEVNPQNRERIERENQNPFDKREGGDASIINQIRTAKAKWEEQQKKTPALLPLLDELGQASEMFRSGAVPEGSTAQSALAEHYNALNEVFTREGGIYDVLQLSGEKRKLESLKTKPALKPIADIMIGYRQDVAARRKMGLDVIPRSRPDPNANVAQKDISAPAETSLDRRNQEIERQLRGLNPDLERQLVPDRGPSTVAQIQALKGRITERVGKSMGVKFTTDGPVMPNKGDVTEDDFNKAVQAAIDADPDMQALKGITGTSANTVRVPYAKKRGARADVSGDAGVPKSAYNTDAPGREGLYYNAPVSAPDAGAKALRQEMARNRDIQRRATAFGNLPMFLGKPAEDVVSTYRSQFVLPGEEQSAEAESFARELSEQLKYRMPGSLGVTNLRGKADTGKSGEQMAYDLQAETGLTRPGGLEELPVTIEPSVAEKRKAMIEEGRDLQTRMVGPDQSAAPPEEPPSRPTGVNQPMPSGDTINVHIVGQSAPLRVMMESGASFGTGSNVSPMKSAMLGAQDAERGQLAGLNVVRAAAGTKSKQMGMVRRLQEQGHTAQETFEVLKALGIPDARYFVRQVYGDDALSSHGGGGGGAAAGAGGGGRSNGILTDEGSFDPDKMPVSVALPRRLDSKRFTKEQIARMRRPRLAGPTRAAGEGDALFGSDVGQLQFMPPAWFAENEGINVPQGAARTAAQQAREIGQGERLQAEEDRMGRSGGFNRAVNRLRAMGIDLPDTSNTRTGAINDAEDKASAEVAAILRRAQGTQGQRSVGPMVTSSVMNVLAGSSFFQRERVLPLDAKMAANFNLGPNEPREVRLPGDPFSRFALVQRERSETGRLAKQQQQAQERLREHTETRDRAAAQIPLMGDEKERLKATAQLEEMNKAVKEDAEQVSKATDATDKHAAATKFLADNAVNAADILGNLGQGFVGGIAGGFVAQGVSAAMQAIAALAPLAKMVFGPAFEAATGYQNVTNKVVDSLSDQVRATQGATHQTIALAAAQAGITADTYKRIGPGLEQAATTEAGNKAYQDYSDLIRAGRNMERTGMERGLFSNTNGLNIAGIQTPLFGTPSAIENFTNQFEGIPDSTLNYSNNPIGATFQLGGLAGRGFNAAPSMIQSLLTGQFDQLRQQTMNMIAPEGLGKEQVDDTNAQLEKIGSQFRVQQGAPDSIGNQAFAAAAAAGGAPDYLVARIHDLGLAWVDANGKEITSTQQATEAVRDWTRSLSQMDPQQYADSLVGPRGELTNQILMTRMTAELGRRSMISNFGLQNVANPPMRFGEQFPLDQPNDGGMPLALAQGYSQNLGPDAVNLTAQYAQMQAAATAATAERIQNLVDPADQQAALEQLNIVTDLGKQIHQYNAEISHIQWAAQFRSMNREIAVTNRQLGEAAGLAGQAGASDLGIAERAQLDLSRKMQDQQFEHAQKSLNYQTALAGFLAPGATGEEIATRVRIAEKEAKYQQTQLDESKQSVSLGRGIEDTKNLQAYKDLLYTSGELQKQLNDMGAVQALSDKLALAQNNQSLAMGLLESYMQQSDQITTLGINLIGAEVKLGATVYEATQIAIKTLAQGYLDLQSVMSSLPNPQELYDQQIADYQANHPDTTVPIDSNTPGTDPKSYLPPFDAPEAGGGAGLIDPYAYLSSGTPAKQQMTSGQTVVINNPSAGVDTTALTRVVINELNRQGSLRNSPLG